MQVTVLKTHPHKKGIATSLILKTSPCYSEMAHDHVGLLGKETVI